MDGNIYLINGRELKKVQQQEFSDEDTFQALLEEYPDLLAGEQIDKTVPRRWLLVKREMGINVDASNNGRWSIDHFFVDQDGIPTLVEVKRSSDTRIRREVVGQMLDYAANVSYYWKKEKLQQAVNSTYEDAHKTVLEFLESDEDNIVEEFWGQVDENIREGKIRLVFVADQIPLELQRIIEFMNEQMDPAEVLGVELKHFTDGELKVLVPQVIGLTAHKQAKSREGSGKRKPNATLGELQDTAYNQGIGELYDYAVKKLLPFFRTTSTTVSSLSLKDKFQDSKSSAILNLIPGESGEKGLSFQIYLKRFSQLFNVDKKVIEEKLPANKSLWEYQPTGTITNEDWSGFCGYFANEREIDVFLESIQKN